MLTNTNRRPAGTIQGAPRRRVKGYGADRPLSDLPNVGDRVMFTGKRMAEVDGGFEYVDDQPMLAFVTGVGFNPMNEDYSENNLNAIRAGMLYLLVCPPGRSSYAVTTAVPAHDTDESFDSVRASFGSWSPMPFYG